MLSILDKLQKTTLKKGRESYFIKTAKYFRAILKMISSRKKDMKFIQINRIISEILNVTNAKARESSNGPTGRSMKENGKMEKDMAVVFGKLLKGSLMLANGVIILFKDSEYLLTRIQDMKVNLEIL
jgi:hypothetical protein